MNTTERINLQLFAHANPFVPGTTPGTPTTNPVTLTTSMNPTMKVFYDTSLLENSREENVFGQFSKKQPIRGNKVEWRKFNKFEKAIEPLKEGVIPSGQEFGMSNIEATVTQHGSYTAVSDRLEMEAFDDVIYGATEEMGASAGATKDTLTRNALESDDDVFDFYAPIVGADGSETEVLAESSLTKDAKLTPEVIARVATDLKKGHAPKIDGMYVAIAHPSVIHDLRQSDAWVEAHKYTDATPIFNGEVGELHGIRFVISTACKVSKTGASSAAVYSTYVFGKDAYGEIEPNGETMEMIIKGKEYGGPLNQFSTIGYKFTHGAKVLYPERIIIVKSGSSFSEIDQEN